MDFIGKKENIRNDLIYAFGNAEIPYKEKVVKNESRKNVSSSYKKDIIWDKDLRDRMIVVEAPSMIRFGYMSVIEIKNKIQNIK